MQRMILIGAVVLGFFAPAFLATAEAGCCNRCGSDDLVCQLTWVTKDVVKTRYDIECSPHCLAPRTERMCDQRGCKKSCSDSGCTPSCTPSCTPQCGPQGCGDGRDPGCGRVRTKRTLVKYQCVVQECVCKWIVVSNCGCDNGGCCGSYGTPVPGETKPAPPTANIGDELLPTPDEMARIKQRSEAGNIRTASVTMSPQQPAPVVEAISPVFK